MARARSLRRVPGATQPEPPTAVFLKNFLWRWTADGAHYSTFAVLAGPRLRAALPGTSDPANHKQGSLP